MERHYLHPLFDPATVLVYAAPGDPLRAALDEGAFDGQMRSVDMDAAEAGKAIVLPVLALIALPEEATLRALADAGRRRARAAIVYGVRFSEHGVDALKALARQYGIFLLGPDSMGLQRPHLHLNACLIGKLQLPGNLALVSQSGSLTAAMLDWADSNGVKFSTVVALGRSAALDVADVLDFLAADARTHSIVLYLEGIRDARRFMSALRAAARSKPVVVLKAGRREGGKRAALTHSGAMVGGDDVFDAALRRAGVVRVDSFVQLFSAAKCLAARYRPAGNRLGIVSNGGGPAVLAADYAHLRDIAVAQVSAEIAARLREQLPDAPCVDNPVDIGENAGAPEYTLAVETLIQDPGVDGVLVVVTPKPGIDSEAIAAAAISHVPSLSKPVIACWMGETRAAATRRAVNDAGMPVFRLPEAAVDAFANIAQFYRNQQLLLQTPPPLTSGDSEDNAASDIDAARQLIATVLAEGRSVMTETESKALLSSFHIPVTPTLVAHNMQDAVAVAGRLGYPVALKINSPDIAHKSDVGGVMLNVRTAAQVEAVFAAMLEEVAHKAPCARLDGVAIQPMVNRRNGREVYLGVSTDALFGPVISFGMGGTLVELFDDRTVTLPPLNRFLAGRVIERAPMAARLREWRGMPAASRTVLETLLMRVSEMICELPELRELDINPVIIDEHGAVAVDARAVVAPSTAVARGPYSHMAIVPYPSYLTGQIKLKDGTVLNLRAIRPEDAEALQTFVRGLSDESRYNRFIASIRELPQSLLSRFTQIDYDREVAIVAFHADEHGVERIVGVARYMLNPDAESCEFGLVVGDDYQGRGVGSGLMRRLAEIARSKGLKSIIGLILSQNTGMLGLMEHLGYTIESDPDDPDMKQAVLKL
jgi:acetyltransferase